MRLNRYRIQNLETVRKEYLALVKEQEPPIVICANHLTYVDSLLIAYALGGLTHFLLHFHSLPWNLPKKTNVRACWYYPLLCYLGKCLQLPVELKGAKEVLETSKALLNKQQAVLLFPEGTRSESGRIEPEMVQYGIGELIESSPNSNALLIYLRGNKTSKKAKYPEQDQTFYVKLQVQTFHSEKRGRRAHREIAQEVILSLKRLEDEYFEHRK